MPVYVDESPVKRRRFFLRLVCFACGFQAPLISMGFLDLLSHGRVELPPCGWRWSSSSAIFGICGRGSGSPSRSMRSGTALGRRHRLLPARHEPGHADVDGLRRSRRRGSAAASADVRDRRIERAGRSRRDHRAGGRRAAQRRSGRGRRRPRRWLLHPREVRLGLASDGRQQVTEGLDGGEEIVVSSQFLIDSESNLKAAIDQLLGERAEAGSGR